MSPENLTQPVAPRKNWSGQISLRSMTMADIPFGLGLSEAEGWNQTEEDWEMLLANSSSGSLVASFNGIEAGTLTTISYQNRLHWIGMVLVAEEFRRRGIGKALLEAALDKIGDQGTIFLDATPAGLKLYESLGFQVTYELARLQRQPAQAKIHSDGGVFPFVDQQLPEIVQYDLHVFGADRSRILRNLLQRTPLSAFHRWQSGKPAGFCLGRHGIRFTQIGPIVADNVEIGRELFCAALTRYSNQEIIVDARFRKPDWNQFLYDMGFHPIRLFTRMSLGDDLLPQLHEKQLAIAGPEIG